MSNIEVKKSVPVSSSQPVKRNPAKDRTLADNEHKKSGERRPKKSGGELGQWVDDYA